MHDSIPLAGAKADGVTFAAVMPHAPILVRTVGASRQHAQAGATITAMEEVARRLVNTWPDVVVVISPHLPQRRDGFPIWSLPLLRGSFVQFGARESEFVLPLDRAFADRLAREARTRGVQTWRLVRGDLDYGAAVPLAYLVEAGWQSATVVVGVAPAQIQALRAFGEAIAATAAALHRRTAVVASGEMGHRVPHGAARTAPAEDTPFDRQFVEILRQDRLARLAELDTKCGEVDQDVFASTLVALSAMQPRQPHSSLLSYEDPFGVGYSVAVVAEMLPSLDDASAPMFAERTLAHLADLPFVARAAVCSEFSKTRPSCPYHALGSLLEPRGVFVTLRAPGGVLRGFWGSRTPEFTNLVEATWHLARFAAFHDPRFEPLRPEEVRGVRFSVSVLDRFEPIQSVVELDPALYGLSIRAKDGRRSLMLPAIKGIEFPLEQLRAAKRKAGVGLDEPVEMERFTAATYSEPKRDETLR